MIITRRGPVRSTTAPPTSRPSSAGSEQSARTAPVTVGEAVSVSTTVRATNQAEFPIAEKPFAATKPR